MNFYTTGDHGLLKQPRFINIFGASLASIRLDDLVNQRDFTKVTSERHVFS